MLAPPLAAGSRPHKPGAAMAPQAGVVPVLLDAATGAEIDGPASGLLALKAPWPSMARTCWGDHERCADRRHGGSHCGRGGK